MNTQNTSSNLNSEEFKEDLFDLEKVFKTAKIGDYIEVLWNNKSIRTGFIVDISYSNIFDCMVITYRNDYNCEFYLPFKPLPQSLSNQLIKYKTPENDPEYFIWFRTSPDSKKII